MKEFKGTSGPWEKGKNGFGDSMMVYCDDELGSAVADCSVKHSMKLTIAERLANAKLIAAAPELLEALQNCLMLMKHFQQEYYIEYEVAEAAINKALS